MTFRPTHDVGPRTQCMSGLNHAAYGLPVNASRPGSPQAHASLGSGWRPTLAGWNWIPTGFRTRFQRSHHGILSPLTGLSRHTRWCTNRNWHATVPTTGASSIDGVGSWAAHVGHRIQHIARELRFDRSPTGCPGSKTIAADRRIPEEGVLDSRLLMVAWRLLPPSPSDALHRVDCVITSARPRPPSGHPGRRGRRDHAGRAPCTGRIVEATRVVGGVRGDARAVVVDGLDQLDARRRVIARRVRERVRDDHTGCDQHPQGVSSTRACHGLHVAQWPIHPRRQSTGQCCR